MASTQICRERDVQVSEATAAKRTLYYVVGTHEAQTITVSKAGAGFGATAGSTGTQVAGTTYKLVIHADDIDTEGEVAFLSTGATDDVTIYGIQIVDHDPFDDVATLVTNVAAILADTGTDGVVIADGHLTAAKFGADFLTNAKIADDALGAEHFAADWLEAAGLKTDAADKIADEVLKELIADHKATAGSFAEFLNFIRQRAGAGKLITDTNGDTVKTYDTDGSTVLKTQTKSTAGTVTTWTPS